MTRRQPHRSLRRLPPRVLSLSRHLRHSLTPAEEMLWKRLRDHQIGPHIRRQHILLGRYVADFYCSESRLCIEIDGDAHAEAGQEEHDTVRTAALRANGIRVVRFTNSEVLRNLDSVVEAIRRACEAVK